MTAKVDAILVDDDAWIRDHWQQTFRDSGKKLATYPNPNSFMKGLHKHSVETPIFIDYRFKNLHRNGSEIARLALRKGYRRLYITSHLQRGEMDIPNYIADVTDKNPPLWLLESEDQVEKIDLAAKREILASFTALERERFKQRMQVLYDAKFGAASMLISPFENNYTNKFARWENAIYLQKSDEELEKILSGNVASES